MEKLLQQIRDNQRFDNWVFFPGNKVEILYHEYSDTDIRREIHLYKRKDKDGTWICEHVIQKTFDGKHRLVEEEYIVFPKRKENGTDNV